MCVLTQGEKGEPGIIVAADGSMMSSVTGPAGPRGVKVIIVVTSKLDPLFFNISCVLFPPGFDFQNEHVELELCLFAG